MSILIFIQVNTSAQNVANVVTVLKNWRDTGEVIQGRNRLNVQYVTNDLQRLEALSSTAEFTMERNHTSVTCVTKRSMSLGISSVT